jgi:hypothetical protein
MTQVDRISEVKRLVIRIGREFDKIEQKGVGFGPQPQIDDPVNELEEILPLTSWYACLAPWASKMCTRFWPALISARSPFNSLK